MRCLATVYHRDTLRYTGRGPHGFEMHYVRKQCKRQAQAGRKCCYQHRDSEAREYYAEPEIGGAA